MKDPIVSVVIPSYNQSRYLRETVESALGSTYPHLEIVIVDDGSTDDSKELAMDLSARHVKVSYYSQQNAGPSAARNHGIRKAKGKYILPLDGDDLISEEYIKQAVDVVEKDQNVKVVYCKARKFGAVEGEWKLKPFSRAALAEGNMIFVSALFRKKDWEKVGGFSEEMTWGFEDWEFWISMLKEEGEVVQLPITGFYYRIRKGSRRKGVSARDRQLTYSFINTKHKDFIYAQLGGPIRKSKTWSKQINRLLKRIGLDPCKNS
ncbi:glycosyltransferase family 2 protein [Pleomorphovibrio marinus]|uniref:glycosyltransferase family 2 protein n=1 Tax=Pleomorphovibrio marinus TaxID=2164132 RepID=UPI000E0B1D67|nr:glycosyltransferase family A protein [Pleomorphovibrio marinus]